LRDSELTKLLGWPGYRVYRHEINERGKTLKLWIRQQSGQRRAGWFGRERKKETLDEFFLSELSVGRRMRITAACVGMWELSAQRDILS